jgi:16S rRNA (cytidine1402-2'-O)-methyltransferase
MPGELFIVSTPIGNLKDITIRALEVLKAVDIIACEDTRTTSVLLKHYDIHKELISLNAVNEKTRIEILTDRIKAGTSIALVSDAGTPTISDPGVRLISKAISEKINVISIPGATALIAALTISGLPTDSFIFEGFIPQKKGRQKKLKELSQQERTVIFYESMHRIEKLLKELVDLIPERQIVVCRELTKKFEETWRGTPLELLDSLNQKNVKGEFVVLIAPLDWKKS